MKLFNHPVIQSIKLFSKALSFDCGRCNQRGLYIIIESGDYMSSAGDTNTIEKLKTWLEELENQMNSPDFQMSADKFKPQIDELREKISQMCKPINETRLTTYKKVSFEECFDIYLKYMEDNKTANIAYDYCTPDGIRLGDWVHSTLNQKIQTGILQDSYVEKLRQLPYDQKVKPLYWHEWFDIAVSLIDKSKYNYIPDIYYEKVYKVGGWLKRQISHINDLPIEQKEKIITTFDSLLPNKYRHKSEFEIKHYNEAPEDKWHRYISALKSSNEKLDRFSVIWIQNRIADYLSISHSGGRMTLSEQQSQELYELICDLLQTDRIDFIDNYSLSANDYIKFCKKIIDRMEQDEIRKNSLFKVLDLKYVNKFVSLSDITAEHFEQRSDRSIAESSFLSIAQVYVNTCENNTLSARQNAELLKIRTYSSNDPYDLF